MINKSSSREISIRPLRIILDLEDSFKPPLLLEDFIDVWGTEPSLPRFKIVEIEILTCPEDGQPITVSECGKCSKFVRRFNCSILCRSPLAMHH